MNSLRPRVGGVLSAIAAFTLGAGCNPMAGDLAGEAGAAFSLRTGTSDISISSVATVTRSRPTPGPDSPEDPFFALEVLPSEISIDLESSFSYKATTDREFGLELEQSAFGWTSSDPSVATIDADGLVVPVGTGVTYVTASLGDVESPPARLEVVEPGTVWVKAIDVSTGMPVAGAKVYLGYTSTTAHTTDSEGNVIITGDFAGRQTFSSALPDYHWTTVMDVLNREVVIPMRSLETTAQGQFSGRADFSEMGTLARGGARVGLITRSFAGNPTAMDPLDIFGDFRDVYICGVPVPLPSNVVGQISTSCGSTTDLLDWSVPAPTGTYDTYMLAGNITTSTVVNWLGNPDAFTDFGQILLGMTNLDSFAYDYLEDIPVQAPYETGGLYVTPNDKTQARLLVDVPTVPAGVSAPPMLVALADLGEENYLPIGLAGAGSGEIANVYFGPDFQDYPHAAVAFAAEDGVGNEGAYAVVSGRQTSGSQAIRMSPFMDLIEVTGINYANTTYDFVPVEDADVYHSIFTWRFKKDEVVGGEEVTTMLDVEWDVYQPPGSTVLHVPEQLPRPRSVYADWTFISINWELNGYDNGDWTYDLFTTEPGMTLYDSSKMIERVSRNLVYNVDDKSDY